MKKILSILGAITLIGTSSTSLVACNKSNEYTAEQLKKLKEENKINTKDKTIRDNLEWMASQETPFNKIDNKWYYVLWRGDKNDNWRLIKFQNNEQDKLKNKDQYDKYNLALVQDLDWDSIFDLTIQKNVSTWIFWHKNNQYFKSVYRWNLDTKEPDLILDKDGNLKVNGE